MLSLHDIRVERDGSQVLALPAMTIDPAAFTAILGHNGSGKSTLMNLLARQIKPDAGGIELEGRPLGAISARDFARRVAFLPQQLPPVDGLSVAELVRLGRYPWRGMLGRWQDEDARLVQQAMHDTDIRHLAQRPVDQLSGGERQRAWLAMLLAQQSPLILLDEPTSALDLAHQYELMSLLARLNRDHGRGMVVILHDVNLAARYAQRIVALKHGRLYFDGTPQELLDAALLTELFGLPMQLMSGGAARQPVAVVA
jgi:iron complex transport system ATP-binding protein